MTSFVYLNGELVPEDEAKISIFDIGFMYGAVFMEALRTFRHEPYRLDDHLERLERTMRYAGLEPLVTQEEMGNAVRSVLEANLSRFEADDDCWICAQVTPGQGFPQPLVKSTGQTRPNVMAYVSKLPYDEYALYYTEGKAAAVSHVRNVPPSVVDPRGKTRFRLHYFMAKLEVAARDPEAFALLLDTDGFITEGTGANIFIVSNGALYTPTTRNVLEGISRNTVIELARSMGIPVHERDLTLYDVYNADEGFWTTSSYCMLPLSRVNNMRIGRQGQGPLTTALLAEWSRQVGVDIEGQARRYANRKSNIWRGGDGR